MAPIDPSMMLVCRSSTTVSIPAEPSSACSQDRRTVSLVRSSSFIVLTGKWYAVFRAGLDRPAKRSMLASGIAPVKRA
jgi:hypothetical protein